MPSTRSVLILVLVACAVVFGSSPRRAGAASGLTFTVARTVQLPPGGAEIVAVSPNGKLAAVTQVSGVVQTFKLPKGKLKKAVDVRAFGEPTSVAFADDATLLIVVKNDPNPGTLVVASAKKGRILSSLSIGIGPDSIAVDRTRKLAVISIEDEETEIGNPFDCPAENTRPGSIQIVDFSRGLSADQLELTTLAVDLSAVADAGCAADPQPEFVAISPDGAKAYVTVQENNALAVVDLSTRSIDRVVSMGTTSHLAYIDPDMPSSVREPMTGRREPDGVAVSPDGNFVFTADEGDTATVDGVFSGGRTMSIWDARTFELVADTGDQIEQAVIDGGFLDASRADRHGPEPEGIAVFAVDGKTIAAVGLERARSVVFFDVTDPGRPTFCAIVPVGFRPEAVVYVPQHRLVLTGNESSGDVTMISVGSE